MIQITKDYLKIYKAASEKSGKNFEGIYSALQQTIFILAAAFMIHL